MSKNVIFQTPKNYQVLRDHKQQVRVQKNPLYDYLHKSSNKSNEMEFLLPLNLEKKKVEMTSSFQLLFHYRNS